MNTRRQHIKENGRSLEDSNEHSVSIQDVDDAAYSDPLLQSLKKAEEKSGAKIQHTVREDGAIDIQGFKLSYRGMDYPKDASRELWDSIGEILFFLEGAIQLLIGDFLNGIHLKHNVTYKDIAAKTGRSEKTLQNYKYVSGAVDTSLRKENLTFGHYNLVAGMDTDNDKKMWLDAANNRRWTVAELHEEIKQSRPQSLPPPVPVIPDELSPDTGRIKAYAKAANKKKRRELVRALKVMIKEINEME